MKFSSVRFLARANIKGNKRGNLIVGIMFFMVISLAKDNDETNIGSNPTKKKLNNKIEEYKIIEICN